MAFFQSDARKSPVHRVPIDGGGWGRLGEAGGGKRIEGRKVEASLWFRNKRREGGGGWNCDAVGMDENVCCVVVVLWSVWCVSLVFFLFIFFFCNDGPMTVSLFLPFFLL